MLARGVIVAESAWQPYAVRKTSPPEAVPQTQRRRHGPVSRNRTLEATGGRPSSKDVELFQGVLTEGPSLLPTSELQPQHANQLFFQAFYFELPGMLFLCSVVQRILQEPQVLPQLHLG